MTEMFSLRDCCSPRKELGGGKVSSARQRGTWSGRFTLSRSLLNVLHNAYLQNKRPESDNGEGGVMCVVSASSLSLLSITLESSNLNSWPFSWTPPPPTRSPVLRARQGVLLHVSGGRGGGGRGRGKHANPLSLSQPAQPGEEQELQWNSDEMP